MKALRRCELSDLIFIDIETVRGYKSLSEAPQIVQDAWDYKMRYSPEKYEFPVSDETAYSEKAALYPEFGKIVCVSLANISKAGELHITSCYETQELRGGSVVDSEEQIIKNVNHWLSLIVGTRSAMLVGHAIKGFDIPFLFRRSLINGIVPHDLFDTSMLKPWEMNALDTLELWKGTGFYSASLLAIASALNLPSPKIDISGAETSEVYYSSDSSRMERIKEYCERDTKTVVNIVKSLRQEPIYE